MRFNRLLSMVLVFVCVLSMLPPVSAVAEEALPEGLMYEIIDGTVTITGYTGSVAELVIPASIEGCSVIGIAENAFSECAFTSIVLPETLQTIGHRAFQFCTSLSQVSYTGTTALWQNITIGVYNDSLLNARIVCQQDPPSETVPENQAPSDPLQIVDEAYALAANSEMSYFAYLSGEITEINTVYSELYDNITVTIQVPGAEDKPIQCYRLCGSGVSQLSLGDHITVIGYLRNYTSSVTVIEFSVGCEMVALLDGEEPSAPSDPLQILDEAYALSHGESLPYIATLTGKIQRINTPYDENYDNISVTIVLDGAEDRPVLCYRMVGDGIDQILPGDTITVKGVILNYNGTVEYSTGSEMISWIDNPQEGSTSSWQYTVTDESVTITGYSGKNAHVVIPDSLDGLPVTQIAANAFDCNYVMHSIVIPKSITSCGQRAFYCPNLEAVYITDLEAWCKINFSGSWSNPLSWGENLYLNGELVSHLVLPDTLTSIGGAFPNCSSIVTVYIPSCITTIDAYAFDGCKNLQHVLYEGTADQWGEVSVGNRNAAFLAATRHENAARDTFVYWNGCSIEGYVCSVCADAILSNKSTATHNFVDGICTNCGSDGSFQYTISEWDHKIRITGYTGSETAVVIPETLEGFPVTAIGSLLSWDSTVVSVSVPKSITYINRYAFSSCRTLKEIRVDEDNTAYSNDSYGVLFNKGKTQLIVAPCGLGGQYAVPDTVISIGDMAFSYNNSLVSVTIPASVTQIGRTPVYGSPNVTGIWVDENNTAYSSDERGVLFDKEKTILLEAPDALDGAYIIPESVTSIADSAFYHCSVDSVIIPEGVTTLEDCAFCCADITSVTIPASVIYVGIAAFNICQYLTDVSYTGTCAQWNAITIEESNDPLLSASMALQHAYGDWVITVHPTFSACGQREMNCAHCGDRVIEELPVIEGKVDSWNVSLSDDLVVNFRLNISQSVAGTAYVRIYVGDTSVTYRASKMEKTEDGLYIASVNVAAAQMSDFVFVTVLNGQDVSDTAVYTVRQYADALLADSSHSRYHALVKEMLNYGAAAQKYFEYCEDSLANEGIDGAGAAEIPDSVDEELTVSGNAEGVSFYAASLVFRNKIAVRYYFRFIGDITGYTFMANGNAYQPMLKDGLYYVEVADILPENIDASVTLTVTDASGNTLSVGYSPMNYIVRMNEKGGESLKNLLKALYNYHLAAKDVRAAV